jgi:hypothetical protein
MALQFGRSAFIKYAKETTYGQAITTTVSNRVSSVSLERSQERERTTHLSQGDAAFATDTFDGFEQSGGSIELPLFYQGNGLLIEVGVGANVATTGTGPFTHVYEPRDISTSPTLDSLTIDFQRGTGSSELFEGCMVSSMTISCEAGGEASLSVDILAETAQSRAGAITPNFGSGVQVFHHQVTNAGLSFDSVNYKIRSFEFSLDNKLERVNNLGSKLTGQPQISDVREVTITATLDLEDNNLYNAQLAGTQGSVQVVFTNGSQTIEFLLRNAKIIDYSDDVNSFGRVERTVTFMGLGVAGGAKPFKIEIVNDATSGISN